MFSSIRSGSAAALLLAAGAAMAQGPNPPVTQGATGEVLALMSPTAVARQMSSGCWVRFFDGQSFAGPALTVVGPTDLPQLRLPMWTQRRWDSVVVGPSARVTTYAEDNYGERVQRMEPGQQLAQLSHGDKEPKSLRVDCVT